MRPAPLGWLVLLALVVAFITTIFAATLIQATNRERRYYVAKIARMDSVQAGLRCADQP